ncbi:unnamed protein product, partial [Urochloa humidicola]
WHTEIDVVVRAVAPLPELEVPTLSARRRCAGAPPRAPDLSAAGGRGGVGASTTSREEPAGRPGTELAGYDGVEEQLRRHAGSRELHGDSPLPAPPRPARSPRLRRAVKRVSLRLLALSR